MSPDALTGFLAWLESAPPGQPAALRLSVRQPIATRQRFAPGTHSTSPLLAVRRSGPARTAGPSAG